MEQRIYLLTMVYLSTYPAQGAEVQMSVQSTAYPPYLYKDEPIIITCTASGYNSINAVLLINGTDPYYKDPYNGCSYGITTGWLARSDLPGLNGLDTSLCQAAASTAPPFILSLDGKVVESMVGMNLICFGIEGVQDFTSTDTLSITNIRAAPIDKPEMSISGEEPVIIEGKKFNFTCRSSGASPPSVYRYEILRNGEVIAITNTYTPVEKDRDGFAIRCTDTVHEVLKYKYPDKFVAEWDLKRHNQSYIKVDIRFKYLNPAVDNSLYCDVVDYQRAGLSYQWNCSGCRQTDTSQVVIPGGSRSPGNVETISCFASFTPVNQTGISWVVNWTTAVTLPTTMPMPTISSANHFVLDITNIVLSALVYVSVVVFGNM